MSTWQQIGALILFLVIMAETVSILLIPYNIDSIAESLKEIAKSLKDKNGGE
ncbi:hypothetical protein [Clostridium botulinum]|uniref:hypothetical protein n=1 Tax=Clostridium botulinum TaxID=1491 RepID=UPI0001AADB0B|nr:hypothetical protein [Clostridium botulinum]EES48895.1 hypothetical protein CLO_1831 [Clostridium botulinum E1 str. 'BoNT E Beluga']MBY6761881.1 hypothetical protein [Clostridium botulinum]MBY6920807.1 hypothetical protein [Clostridium botulinum]MBY6988569.1 hypothetical protein [Clostridium botulinum]MCR1131444.1 hypothetical protein [Clostridium botulinum]